MGSSANEVIVGNAGADMIVVKAVMTRSMVIRGDDTIFGQEVPTACSAAATMMSSLTRARVVC